MNSTLEAVLDAALLSFAAGYLLGMINTRRVAAMFAQIAASIPAKSVRS